MSVQSEGRDLHPQAVTPEPLWLRLGPEGSGRQTELHKLHSSPKHLSDKLQTFRKTGQGNNRHKKRKFLSLPRTEWQD